MTHRTTSTDSAASIPASTKFKIEQPVSSNSIKKGPYAVERAVDPNDVVIKRRFGEGSKPIFERDDISINRGHANDSPFPAPIQTKNVPRRKSRYSSSDSSSPECYRNGKRGDRPHRSLVNPNLTKLENLTPLKRITPEKIPYFADEKRERERLKRRYGSAKVSSSFNRKHRGSQRHSMAHPKRSCSRSPSRSPKKDYKHHLNKLSTQKRRHSKSKSSERERYPSRIHHRSLHEVKNWRRQSPRSRSRTRTRSRSRERHPARHSKERHASASDHTATATQIITIPVPVDPYGYPAGYSWPHLPTWPTAPQAAPRYGAPYSLPPVIPPFADPSIFPPFRPPPPYRMPYNARMLRPRFGPRPPRGSFHPRNY